MSLAAMLTLALLLDAAMGEPRWLWSRLPHPAVLMGRAVAAADRRWNRGGARRLRGILVLAMLAFGALMTGGLLASVLPWPFEVLLVAILLAQKSLVEHVRDVARALEGTSSDATRADAKADDLTPARAAVGRIVGRETAVLDRAGISRAAIESAAENLSDGVVAPVFWYLLGGLPGLLFYKLVNTADSTVGYRTPRHLAFGWASARLDDALNFVPARLTAGLIALAAATSRQPGGGARRGGLAWRIARRDARLHRSPNAGWPEAAMAAALDAALAGPRVYDGTRTSDPFVYPEGRRRLDALDIRRAVRLLWRVWLLMTTGTFLLALLV